MKTARRALAALCLLFAALAGPAQGVASASANDSGTAPAAVTGGEIDWP